MNVRVSKALLLPVVIAAAAVLAAAGLARERPPPSGRWDDPNIHNMMLVGENTAFASHLPMFQGLNRAGTEYVAPHRYQVILEVTFSKDGRDVTQLYLDDRKRNPRVKMYTIGPTNEFVLPTLFEPGSQPRSNRFMATVFRGHLERRGVPVSGLDSVVVNVRRVIHASRFDPAAQRPQRLSYILFGKGGELFLAHSITRPPDFDQILSVRVDGHAFTDDELARGVGVTVPDRPDDLLRRIRPGESATGAFRISGARQPLNLAIRAGTELYFEEGELRMPDTMGTTREEQRSGFPGR